MLELLIPGTYFRFINLNNPGTATVQYNSINKLISYYDNSYGAYIEITYITNTYQFFTSVLARDNYKSQLQVLKPTKLLKELFWK